MRMKAENSACDIKYFSVVVFSTYSFAMYEDLLWDCMSAFIDPLLFSLPSSVPPDSDACPPEALYQRLS
jgi:hypothetical protein